MKLQSIEIRQIPELDKDRDLHPEMTPNEGTSESQHTVVKVSSFSKKSSKSGESGSVVSSLFNQVPLSAEEIQRSMTCFIPIIPLESASSLAYKNEPVILKRSTRTVNKKPTEAELKIINQAKFKQEKPKSKLILSSVRARPQKSELIRRSALNQTKQHIEHSVEKDMNEQVKAVRQKSKSPIQPLTCTDCGKVFARKHGLANHHLVRAGLIEARLCIVCNITFKFPSCLEYHSWKVHKLKLYSESSLKIKSCSAASPMPTCEFCYKTFTRNSGLLYHRRRVHRIGASVERKHQCELCDKTFLKRSHLRLHNQIHTGESLFPCRYCDTAFHGGTGRRVHEEKVHCVTQGQAESRLEDSTQSQEATVPKPFISNKRFRRKKNEPSCYKCSYCDKMFPRRTNLRLHERTHTGEKPYLCSTCGTAFKRQISLREHVKTVHTQSRDLLCSICGEAFSRKMSLKYHILAKHSQNRFKCEFLNCGREFVQKAKLQRHQKIHESSKPHQCKKCNRSYSTLEGMLAHMNLHDEKLQPKVPKVRKSKPVVIRRVRSTPAPVRKLQCSYCDKRFPYRNELEKHEKIHLNIRDFKCSSCGKAFITKYHMWDHMKKAHDYRPEQSLRALVSCQYCFKQFHGPGRLEIHIKSRHLRSRTPTSAKKVRIRSHPDVEHVEESTKTREHDETVQITTREVATPSQSPTNFTAPVIPPLQVHYSIPNVPETETLPVELSSYTVPQATELYVGQRAFHAHGQIQIYGCPSSGLTQVTPIQVPYFEYSAGTNLTTSFNSVPNLGPAQYWQTQQPHEIELELQQTQTINLSAFSDDYSNPAGDYSDFIQVGQSLGADIALSEAQRQDVHFNDSFGLQTNISNENVEHLPGKSRKKATRSKNKPEKKEKAQHTENRVPKQKKVVPPCSTCGKQCGTLQHLKEHEKTHEPKTRFPCSICGKSFIGQHRLKIHFGIHDPNLKPYKCTVQGCNAEFRGSNDVRKHRQETHATPSESQTIHTCKVCNEVFWCVQSLCVHSKIHAEKKFACTHPGCTYSFVAISRLKRHLDTHVEKDARSRPHKCTVCDKSYLRGENLKQHMDSMHPSVNGQCPSDESNSSKFTCPQCPNQYEFKWKLKAHLRRFHNEKKPPSRRKPKPLFYTCDTCDWSFASNVALRNHVNKTHSQNGLAFLCPRKPCDKVYYLVEKLRCHMESQHADISAAEEKLLKEMTRLDLENAKNKSESIDTDVKVPRVSSNTLSYKIIHKD